MSVDLSHYIKELIMVHECIILPNFGGFETTYLPARYDKEQKRMLPPGKKVVFRSEYTKGGDVLENHLVNQLRINSENARKVIIEYVSDIKIRLNNNQNTVVEGVGIFSKNEIGELIFNAFKDENYLADSFGLEPLSLEMIEPPKEIQVFKEPELSIRKRTNTLIYVIIGISVISILLASTIFFASKFDLSLFHIGDNLAGNEMIIIGGEPKSDSLSLAINNEIDEYTSVKKALSYSNEKKIATAEVPVGYTYFLIAGSFNTVENANKLNETLLEDGFTSEVIVIKDAYRVCLGKFIDKNSALNELQRIRKQINRSVWLFSSNEE